MTPTGEQLDLLCAIQRLEQINEEQPADFQHWLWDRVMNCDVPRLRELLTPETLQWEREVKRETMKAIRQPRVTYFAKQPLMPQDAKNYTTDEIKVELTCVEVNGVREYYVTEYNCMGAPIQ